MAIVSRSRSEWRRLIAELEASGESPSSFADRHGVNEKTVCWWRSQFRREKTAVGFVDVEVVDERRAPDLIVELGESGLRVRVAAGFDAGEVRRLVCALC